MNKFLKYIFCSILFCSSLAFISGCANNSGNTDNSASSETSKETSKKDYDLLVFNGDSSIEETDSIEQLRDYMKTSNQPDVFTVNNMKELKEWQESGNILDFSNASEESFKKMVNEIPQNLRLSSNNVDSFGVPCTIQGYGLTLKCCLRFSGEINIVLC